MKAPLAAIVASHVRSIAVLALASLTICSSACAARAEHTPLASAELREALTVSLVVPSSVVVGEETPLRFRLQNSGPRIDACVGVSRNVRILPENDTDGNEPVNVSTRAAGRPRCQQRFRLAPGASFEWSETTRVPGIVLGFASLEVDVSIVDRRECESSTGCTETMLTARAPIEIRPATS